MFANTFDGMRMFLFMDAQIGAKREQCAKKKKPAKGSPVPGQLYKE
jgi:hypothetical protein